MSKKHPDILFVASNDWDGFWYQRQEIATRFAKAGHRVFYFNKTLQRWPKFSHLKERFPKSSPKKTQKNFQPKNLRLVTPIWLPPLNCFRFINRKLIYRLLTTLNINSPVLITDIPTYSTLDLIDLVCASKVIYLNVHNYDACHWILPDLRKAEKLLLQQADFLFADSVYNINRLKRISSGRNVYQSLPGVDYSAFCQAFRGDEVNRRKTIYYFGGIGPHLDFSLYGALADKLTVIFVGVVNPRVKKLIPKNILIRPPVRNQELAEVLKDADILTIFYKSSSYIRGVIPAKFFECLATRKPVLVSGLVEARPYLDVVYDVDGSTKKTMQVINELPKTETDERKLKRSEIAKAADWENRFSEFVKIIFPKHIGVKVKS